MKHLLLMLLPGLSFAGAYEYDCFAKTYGAVLVKAHAVFEARSQAILDERFSKLEEELDQSFQKDDKKLQGVMVSKMEAMDSVIYKLEKGACDEDVLNSFKDELKMANMQYGRCKSFMSYDSMVEDFEEDGSFLEAMVEQVFGKIEKSPREKRECAEDLLESAFASKDNLFRMKKLKDSCHQLVEFLSSQAQVCRDGI